MQNTRPKLVWVITIGMGISLLWSLFALIGVWAGLLPVKSAEAAYFESLSFVDFGITILLGLSGIAGVIALFMLKDVAVKILLAWWLIHTLYAGWSLLAKPIPALNGASMTGGLLGYAVICGITYYAYRLKQTGMLN